MIQGVPQGAVLYPVLFKNASTENDNIKVTT